ncbi:hypothetical protein V2J09_005480 [Rumex salicifolius]
MAPHGEAIFSGTYSTKISSKSFTKPPKLSPENLYRTISDISFELSNIEEEKLKSAKALPPISEVEDVECECCGMNEECTPEYIRKIKEMYLGKWICGLCSEAVKEEMENRGGRSVEEALGTHMGHCMRFNKLGRAYPVLCQAQAMREMLKKSGSRARAQSMSPKDHKKGPRPGAIPRSSSCMPALAREMNGFGFPN